MSPSPPEDPPLRVEATVHCAYSEIRLLSGLRPHPKNPNRHPPEQLALLGKVILGTGWRAPIVVSKRSGLIIKGHGRREAAQLVGLTHGPVDLQDYATAELEIADLIADNRIAELAELSLPDLKELLRDCDNDTFDFELAGFTDTALEELLASFDVDEATAPELAEGDRQPFRQMTFNLHDSQFSTIAAAMAKARAAGGAASEVNENTNGNALAFICSAFLRG